ncbi:hypothetical protein PDIG_29770 [Penicillium digitatum PHI26]|uniref:Uncharacterized protein n=3 Tax=Penicillium digitatum TaxID=36651 RepID=K9GJM0_PEND2|nr:hypothetical protein PDIP_64150 [Penicillium digitatum Pd1]EKV09488.1 hypothetical protein PDIP_64150 [Penicillium digitatum Pd1]EKV14898.1 hypothetical protein PDIG_29770 [Penicillium digitatum PHI26]
MEKALELYRQGIALILDLRVQISHEEVSIRTQFPIELLTFVETDLSSDFASIDSARTIMHSLAAEIILFDREANLHLRVFGTESSVSPEMVTKQEALRARLAEWHRAYTKLFHRNSSVPTHPDPILLTYHAAALITVTGCLREQETVFDVHFVDFVTIVEQSRLILDASAGPNGVRSPFTFEMSVGVPLARTVLRCRDANLRRRALDLLRLAPPI